MRISASQFNSGGKVEAEMDGQYTEIRVMAYSIAVVMALFEK